MFNRANAIIEEIKTVERQVKSWREGLPDPAAEIMLFQYENMKRGLVRDLLAELIRQNMPFQPLESLFQDAGFYLKKSDSTEPLPPEMTSRLGEVRAMLV